MTGHASRGMREVDANETSDELGSAFGELLWVVVPVENTIVISVDWVGHSSSSGIGRS